jgi:hypothetical protein
VIAGALAECIGRRVIEAPLLATLDYANIREFIGDPDFILRDDNTCVLGESKVAAHANSARYSFEQFTKYMTLGAVCECSRNPSIRRAASHVLLVPNADPREFCDDFAGWKPQVVDTELRVSSESMTGRDRKERSREFSAWCRELSETLTSTAVRLACDLDDDLVQRLLARLMTQRSPVVVPTYVVTWSQVMQRCWLACDAQGFTSLRRAAGKLHALAYGAADEADTADDGEPLGRFVANNVVIVTRPVATHRAGEDTVQAPTDERDDPPRA